MQGSQSLVSEQSVGLRYTGRSQRAIAVSNDGLYGPGRVDRDNTAFVQNIWNSLHALVSEGSLYIAQTATPGSGIAFTPTAGNTYSDTQAIFGINNVDPLPSLNNTGRDIIPLWLKIIITATGNAGTDAHFAFRLDQKLRVSAGTALTGANANPSFPGPETASYISVLPTVAAATGAVRNAGRAEGRKAGAPAYVIGDVITFVFGTVEQVQAQAITAATAIGLVLPVPPVIIPPGWSLVVNEWMGNRITTAQSGEFELGYIVR